MRIVKLFVVVLSIFSLAYGGEIDPQLANKIDQSKSDAQISVLIFMKDQVDVASISHRLDMSQASLAQRHLEIITALQEKATESQADIMANLANGKLRNTVGSYEGFWINNMIYAELTPDEITSLASRSDVARIYLDFKGELVKPIIDDNADNPPIIAGTEAGVRAIRANEMWALGFTGRGRLVCNIDTGVDGSHPALNHSWRGANGYPARESWLDTADRSNNFPHDEGQHGTHTMGTICGRSTTTADTVGVAIDAEWIAARAVDVTGGNIASAFQWAVDPDGDPNTMSDVPDVISNSWGILTSECPPDYYNLIDNCEAAGIVVVFAAGNEGPEPQTLRVPANRITTPYNCFAVGAIDGNNGNFPIASFSSRGPSNCDGVTIKPEVVAPGVNVRSSIPGGSYQGGWSGTSMACPHVAGAVALLRQVNPNASVDTIKWALMNSAHDLGNTGEDNSYGFGIINVRAAMDLLPANNLPRLVPDGVRISDQNDNIPDPGETISLFVKIRNTGVSANNIAAVLSTENQYATITEDSAYYGTINQNDTLVSATPYTIALSSSAPVGSRIVFQLNIVASGGYTSNSQILIKIGSVAPLRIATHNVGNVGFSISNFAQYGLNPGGINPNWQGQGFKMPRNGLNNLYEGALLIGTGPTRLSNCARDQDQNIPQDFQPIDTIQSFIPGPFADQEFHTIFSDQDAADPLGVEVTQKSFAFSASPDNDYIIIEYTIRNTSSSAINGLLVSHYQDWDIPNSAPTDHVNFDRSRNLGYQYNSNVYRGQQVLSDLGVSSFKALDNTTEVYPPRFTLQDKWSYMTAGIADTALITPADYSMMITTGPYDIAPQQSVVAAFGILGGTSLNDIQTNATAALAKYASMTSVDRDNSIIPENYFLLQNYPNPFNARTTISFVLPAKSHVLLEAFDLLGRKVGVLADGEMDSGNQQINWDCSKLSSGIYFYRLSADGKSDIKKMMLLK